MNPLLANALEILAWVLPVLFAITVHEAAHAFAAWRFGDNTARDLGRLTLNPIPHLSLVGSVLVPALAIAFSGMAFGWAKPVPVNLSRTPSPRYAMVCVALAGPASNLVMLIAWSALLLSLPHPAPGASALGAVAIACQLGILANVSLMVFNLLPVPPLDGGRVLTALLPISLLRRLGAWHNWVGFLVVMALVFSGVASDVLVGAIERWIALVNAVAV